VQSAAKKIMGFAKVHGLIEHSPFADIDFEQGFAPHKEQKRPAITDDKECGTLLRKLDAYEGRADNLTYYALQLLALTFVRPGTVQKASGNTSTSSARSRPSRSMLFLSPTIGNRRAIDIVVSRNLWNYCSLVSPNSRSGQDIRNGRKSISARNCRDGSAFRPRRNCWSKPSSMNTGQDSRAAVLRLGQRRRSSNCFGSSASGRKARASGHEPLVGAAT
jgi:hypothetical protein